MNGLSRHIPLQRGTMLRAAQWPCVLEKFPSLRREMIGMIGTGVDVVNLGRHKAVQP
jgi:hypothetical protein